MFEIINGIYIVKFDNKTSKYDNYIYNMNVSIRNITDENIIESYDIELLPTLYIYKDKNLVKIIEGFKTKSELVKIIQNL